MGVSLTLNLSKLTPLVVPFLLGKLGLTADVNTIHVFILALYRVQHKKVSP